MTKDHKMLYVRGENDPKEVKGMQITIFDLMSACNNWFDNVNTVAPSTMKYAQATEEIDGVTVPVSFGNLYRAINEYLTANPATDISGERFAEQSFKRNTEKRGWRYVFSREMSLWRRVRVL